MADRRGSSHQKTAKGSEASGWLHPSFGTESLARLQAEHSLPMNKTQCGLAIQILEHLLVAYVKDVLPGAIGVQAVLSCDHSLDRIEFFVIGEQLTKDLPVLTRQPYEGENLVRTKALGFRQNLERRQDRHRNAENIAAAIKRHQTVLEDEVFWKQIYSLSVNVEVRRHQKGQLEVLNHTLRNVPFRDFAALDEQIDERNACFVLLVQRIRDVLSGN